MAESKDVRTGVLTGDYLKHVVLKYIEYCQKGDLKSQSDPRSEVVRLTHVVAPQELSSDTFLGFRQGCGMLALFAQRLWAENGSGILA